MSPAEAEHHAPSHRGRDLAWLAVVSAILLVAPVGIGTLWDKHEGRFLESARGMLATGDWVIPRILGEPVWFYPPLCAWLIAICGKVLGLSEFAARLPGGLAALGCVLMTYEFGRLLFDRRAAVLAAIALLTMPVWPKTSVICEPDSIVVLMLMLSLYALLRIDRAEKWRWPWAVLYWAAFAVSGLAKGPPGPIMTIAVSGAYAVWDRKWKLAIRLNPLLGAVVVAAIAAPWILAAKNAAGVGYLNNMWHEFRDMSGGGEKLMHARPNPFYYLPKLAGAAPWILFAIAAAVVPFAAAARDTTGWVYRVSGLGKVLRALTPPESTDPAERSAIRFLVSWAGVIVLMLSVAKAKRPYYLLPIYPAVALLAAMWWTRVPAWGRAAARWRERLPVLVIGLTAVAGLVVPWVLPAAQIAKNDITRPLLAVAGAATALGALAFVLVHTSGRRAAAFATLAACLFVALGFQQFFGTRWTDAGGRRGAEFCASVRSRIGPDTRLVVHHVDSFVPFYLNTPFEIAREPEEAAALAKPGTMLLVERDTYYDPEKPELREAWEAVATADTNMADVVLCKPRR